MLIQAICPTIRLPDPSADLNQQNPFGYRSSSPNSKTPVVHYSIDHSTYFADSTTEHHLIRFTLHRSSFNVQLSSFTVSSYLFLMQKVIGLAGHIDHGKTALVKALTGVDTDRLAEEKRRGVTIDIGIAFYSEDVTFIDVPGHERFVKNMVTGVSTVDMAMLVIAADDGVMPQTREHLDILKLLGVNKILVALNKIDLVEVDWVELVSEEIQLFLAENEYPETTVIPVSAVEETGIDELRMALDRMLKDIVPRENRGLFRLPIDRVFSVKGFGTVVTGTVLSHELRRGQQVQVYPEGQTYVVRGLQSHHQDVDLVRLGDRAALNLAGASVDDLGRGAFLGNPELYQTGHSWVGRLTVLKDWDREVQEADRVHIHVGTGKQEARLHLLDRNRCRPGESCPVQVFFDESVSAASGELTVVRFESPEFTLGGIELRWCLPKRLKKSDPRVAILDQIGDADLKQAIPLVLEFFGQPMTLRQLAQRLSYAESKISGFLKAANGIREYEQCFLLESSFLAIKESILARFEAYHEENPLGGGLAADAFTDIPAELLEFVTGVMLEATELSVAGSRWQLAGHETTLSAADENMRKVLVEVFSQAVYAPPSIDELVSEYSAVGKKVLDWMISHGELVRIDSGFYVLKNQVEAYISLLKDWFREHETLSVPEAKTFIPTTRKYILPLLNYAERKAYVLRQGDVRIWIGEELGD